MIAFLILDLDICGGTHKQFLKMLEYTEKQGEDFYIITRKLDLSKTYPGFSKYADRIRLFPIRKKSSSFIGKMRILIESIRELKELLKPADYVNIHDNGFDLYLPAFRGKKVFWQINDLPSYFKVGVSANSPDTLKKWICRNYVLLFRKIVTEYSVNVTKNRERVRKCLGREAHVFYCGIEPVGIARDINISLERFRKKSIQILSSGVFFPYRNYETQIAVVEKLCQKGIDVHLNIIGSTLLDTAYSCKIETLIKKNNLSDRITIHGQVDGDTFCRLHKEADLFMFINVDQSWGLAVFEAMSCALPVIVSRSVGATEILSDEKNALFVDPMDAEQISRYIENLMSDKERYVQLANESRCFHTLYTWDDAYCSKMLNLILNNEAKYK